MEYHRHSSVHRGDGTAWRKKSSEETEKFAPLQSHLNLTKMNELFQKILHLKCSIFYYPTLKLKKRCRAPIKVNKGRHTTL